MSAQFSSIPNKIEGNIFIFVNDDQTKWALISQSFAKPNQMNVFASGSYFESHPGSMNSTPVSFTNENNHLCSNVAEENMADLDLLTVGFDNYDTGEKAGTFMIHSYKESTEPEKNSGTMGIRFANGTCQYLSELFNIKFVEKTTQERRYALAIH